MARYSDIKMCTGTIDSKILLRVLQNSTFRTVYAIFALHVLVILYLLFFKWKLNAFKEMKWYVPRIRRHLATATGMASVALGISGVSTAESDCAVARLFVCSSCLLSLLAVFCAYGYNRRPDGLVGLSISLISLSLCIPSVRTFHMLNTSDYVNLRLIFGSYHLVMGLLLYFSGAINRPEDTPWHLRNGIVHLMR